MVFGECFIRDEDCVHIVILTKYLHNCDIYRYLHNCCDINRFNKVFK